MFEDLLYEEALSIDAGGVREVVTTTVGVMGGVLGAAGGFLGGFAVTTIEFTPLVGVPVGIVCAGVGATIGYGQAKSAAENAWDAIADCLK